MSPASKPRASGRTKRRPADGMGGGGPPGRGPGIPPTGVDRPLGLTQALRRTLRFTKVLGLTAAAGGYAESYYYLNSGFHIDTAADAVGYDKYMQFYSKCFAVGARIQAQFASTAGNANPAMVGIAVTTNATSLGSAVAAIENGLCRYKLIGASPDTTVVTEQVDVARFLHKPRVLDDPQLFSTLAAIPGQLVVAHVFAQNSGAATATNCFVWVTVDLEVIFTDPIVFT